MSVNEFSDKAGVSVASVYRFCREMGFSTFSRLKLAIAKDVSPPSRHVPIPAESRAELDNLFQEYIQCLDESESFLDQALASTIAGVILRSKKVIVVGVGASSIPASFLHLKFLEAGIASHRPMDIHLAVMLAANMMPGDVLVAFSASGATKDIVDLAEIARKRSAYVVGITSYYQSPVEEISTHHLLAVSADSPITSGSGSSVISQYAVANAVVDELSQQKQSGRIAD